MIVVNNTLLRAPEPRDVDAIMAGLTDRRVDALAQPTMPRPVQRVAIERRLAEGCASITTDGPNDLEFTIALADDPDATAVGIAGVYERDMFNRWAELGLVIGIEEGRRSHVGGNTLLALADYALRDIGLHRVQGAVKGSNLPALALMARLGMAEEGVLRDARWESGHFVDLHLYGMTEDDWDLNARLGWAEAAPSAHRSTPNAAQQAG